MKDGQLHEYFFPTHEGNEQYGLRKETFYGENIQQYDYTYTTPTEENDDKYFVHKIPNDRKKPWIRTMHNNNQVIDEKKLYNHEECKEDVEFIGRVEEWRGAVEGYLKSVVKEIEKADDEKQDNPYFKKVPQYNPNEVELEEGDVEGFVLYGVNANQLCITLQRGAATSAELRSNKLFAGKTRSRGSSYDFTGDTKAKIYIEKFLEGGISSTSYYYSFEQGAANKIGLGISEMDPNAIIGFLGDGDAGTSHDIKQLRVSMSHNLISDILSKQTSEQSKEVESMQGSELASLRREYDITKIRPRNGRG